MNPPLRLLVAFESLVAEPPDQLVGVEGREMWAAVRWGHQKRWHVHVPDLDAQVLFNPRSIKTGTSISGRPIPAWARYLRGVCEELGYLNLLPEDGARLVIVGDEPSGPRYDFTLAMTFAVACYEGLQHPYSTHEIVELVERGEKK